MHISRQELTNLLPTLKKVHFIGITSPFSSFVASALIKKGVEVTASELRHDTPAAIPWVEKKILYPGGHSATYITDDLELVVFPNGAIPGNPEVAETLRKDLPFAYIQEVLGVLSLQYKTIAIAGTHGKTTTTAMLIWLLHQTVGTPNFIVGDAKDKIGILNTNWESHPDSPYLVIEACEYKKQFVDRAPRPFISVITHIDLDHTNYYPTQESYNNAFVEFLSTTQQAIIIDDAAANEKDVISKGNLAAPIKPISFYRQKFSRFELPLKGLHNQENALRAAAVADVLGISEQKIREALATFPGITARFEYRGTTAKGALVYRDYAHNAAKIAACIDGAKETFPNKRIVVIYQPHNHERTATFRKELVTALQFSDTIIVPNIYSVRETDEEKMLITAEQFIQLLKTAYPDKIIMHTEDSAPYSNTRLALQPFDTPESLFLIMSAGDLDILINPLIDEHKT